MRPSNTIVWTDAMIETLRTNWPTMTNRELSQLVGVALTNTRKKCYELGLKRMELEYWTDEQVAFLLGNYKTTGDKQLAELFNARWHKNKGWTKKHIEKKRKYLGLKRTNEEILSIISNNTEFCEKMNWIGSMDRRSYPVGTVLVRVIKGYRVKLVRVKGGFRKLAHINYEKHFGPIPKGKVIYMKDRDPMNCEPDNLIAVTRAEQAEFMRNSDAAIANWMAVKRVKTTRNRIRTDRQLYNDLLRRPDLLDLKRKQLQLRRMLREKGQL